MEWLHDLGKCLAAPCSPPTPRPRFSNRAILRFPTAVFVSCPARLCPYAASQRMPTGIFTKSGRHTRRAIVQAAQHAEGVMDLVGATVDHVARATTVDNMGDVQSDVAEAASSDVAEAASSDFLPAGSCGPAVDAHGVLVGQGSPVLEKKALSHHLPTDVIGRHRNARAVAVPSSSLCAPARSGHPARRVHDVEEEAQGEQLVYSQADCAEDGGGGMEEAAPLSRGLLGLGMLKKARRTADSDTGWPMHPGVPAGTDGCRESPVLQLAPAFQRGGRLQGPAKPPLGTAYAHADMCSGGGGMENARGGEGIFSAAGAVGEEMPDEDFGPADRSPHAGSRV